MDTGRRVILFPCCCSFRLLLVSVILLSSSSFRSHLRSFFSLCCWRSTFEVILFFCSPCRRLFHPPVKHPRSNFLLLNYLSLFSFPSLACFPFSSFCVNPFTCSPVRVLVLLRPPLVSSPARVLLLFLRPPCPFLPNPLSHSPAYFLPSLSMSLFGHPTPPPSPVCVLVFLFLPLPRPPPLAQPPVSPPLLPSPPLSQALLPPRAACRQQRRIRGESALYGGGRRVLCRVPEDLNIIAMARGNVRGTGEAELE